MRDVAILFDGSLEGFLCVLHAHYYQKVLPLVIQPENNYQPTLEVEEYCVQTDYDIATHVHQAIRKKISPTAQYKMTNAFLAHDDDRFMAIFNYLRLGFKTGAAVDDHMQQDCVMRVRKLAQQVGREAHLLTGFCRFSETEGQIYYCSIEPINYVLPILAEHFCDRMMNQAWIIHDKTYGRAAVYNGKEYAIADVPRAVNIKNVENEAHIQDLWRTFFHSVNINERVNPKVQKNLLPLYFRKSMTEFIGFEQSENTDGRGDTK